MHFVSMNTTVEIIQFGNLKFPNLISGFDNKIFVRKSVKFFNYYQDVIITNDVKQSINQTYLKKRCIWNGWTIKRFKFNFSTIS